MKKAFGFAMRTKSYMTYKFYQKVKLDFVQIRKLTSILERKGNLMNKALVSSVVKEQEESSSTSETSQSDI